ncbi:unnamed protein product [Meganyctiphanes norvegica]|uniref:DZIP3-like HEPN domain-containing protein n=1 Tax=Meganyctiphanes norvegica TaxID=48144 RepID=A0AAV2PRU9_MEGNR
MNYQYDDYDLSYIPFRKRLNMLRYQHAVAVVGQKLLHLVLRSLILGDLCNIKGCLKAMLKSNTQYKNSFTKDELQLLERGEHKRWDITLLFKVVQKVCGLDPAGTAAWNNFDGGDGLEYFINLLKEMRNELVHNFDHVLEEHQLEECFADLTDLAEKITSAVILRIQEQGSQFSLIKYGKHPSDIAFESAETLRVVSDIIEDTKTKINESVPAASSPTYPSGAVPESEDTDEEDDDEYEPESLKFENEAAGAGQEPSLKEVFEHLMKKFWEYAGSEEQL